MVASEHGASEASTASTTNLCSPIMTVTRFTILAESNRVAQGNSKLCEISSDASVEKGNCETDCMQYGLDSPAFSSIATTNGHILRYCVPMDNQRPQLDLKHYEDICPDQNGASLHIVMIVLDCI